MQPATQDQEAETFLGQADKIMRALVTGGKDSHQLVLDTGMDAVTVAKAIHYLRVQTNPPFVETSEINDKFNGKRIIRHYLTDDGRRNLPPPVVPKWNAPDVDPRVSPEKEALKRIQEALETSKKNSFSGLKHVTGMQGKVRIDHEGRIQLGGAKGAILEAVRDKPKISTGELVEITKLPQATVWATCADLVKRDIIEIIKDGNTNLYREVGTPIKLAPPPKPEPVQVVPAPEPVAYKPADSLTQTVRELMVKYDVTDLLLAVVSELDANLKLLKEFQARMQSLTTGEKK
jgi:Winged helix-turn-helix DNA-binding